MKSRIIFNLAVAFALFGPFSSFGNVTKAVSAVSYCTITTNNPDEAYQQYAALQKALTNDDAASAQKAAVELISALKDIPSSAKATKAAVAISKTEDIKVQRTSFATLSQELIKLFKANKPDNVMIYIHYCPMKKAYWLSGSKEILNPYFGKKMPSCGKTTGMII